MNVHKIKETEPYYSDVVAGKKKFAVCPDDGTFNTGDMLLVSQFTATGGYTGLAVQKTAEYIMKDVPGLESGYIAVGFGEYKRQEVNTSLVRMKVLREGTDFLNRTMFGDCPHCGQHITRKDSADNCVSCGGPVSWSENKFFGG